MGDSEDDNGLKSVLELFKNSSSRLLGPFNTASTTQPRRPFLSSSTTNPALVTSKILEELSCRPNIPIEPERITRRRTIHFGNNENVQMKNFPTQLTRTPSIEPSLSQTSDIGKQNQEITERTDNLPKVLVQPDPHPIKEPQMKITRLKHEHPELLHDCENLYQQEITSYQEQLDQAIVECEHERKRHQIKMNPLKEEKQKVESKLNESQRIVVIQQDASKIDSEEKVFEEMAQSLQVDIHAVEKSIVEERDNIREDLNVKQTRQMESLESEKNHLLDQLDDAKNELQLYERSLKNVLSQLSDSQDRLENLEIVKKDLEIRAVENEIAYLDLEEERDDLRNHCDRVNRQLETLIEMNLELTVMADVQMRTKNDDSLEQQQLEFQQDSSVLDMKFKPMKTKIELMSKKVTELAKATSSVENTHEFSNKEYCKKTSYFLENSHLVKQIEENTNANEDLAKEINQLEVNRETLEQHYLILQKSVEELNEVLSQEAERIDVLEEEKKSLTEEIDELIHINEELRSKVEFWRTSVREIEMESANSPSSSSNRHSHGSKNISFSRIQNIYEQRLADQERRFNRLWDDIVTSNEHLQNENQQLLHQLGDIGNDRNSWANYATELQARVDTLSRELGQSSSVPDADSFMKTISDEEISRHIESGQISRSVLDTQLGSLVIEHKHQIDLLENDKQELINYASELEHEIEQLSREFQEKYNLDKRLAQSFAPPTPSDSVNQESLLPYPIVSQDELVPGSDNMIKNQMDQNSSTLADFETDGFASLFADIDQMRDEMARLSQTNAHLQDECHMLKVDRDKMAQKVNQLVEENNSLVTERRELLTTFGSIGYEENTSEPDISKDSRVLELIEKVNRLELSLDNQCRTNKRLKQYLKLSSQDSTNVYSPIHADHNLDTLDFERNSRNLTNTTNSSNKSYSSGAPNDIDNDNAPSKNFIDSLLLRSYAIKRMLEIDSHLLTEIQITLSPDSVESTHGSEDLSDDSRNSSRPVDRDQVTRLFKSLQSLIQNRSILIDDVELIINHLQHAQNQSSSPIPAIVDITSKFNHITLYDTNESVENDILEASQIYGMKGRDSGFSDEGNPLNLQRPRLSLGTKNNQGSIYQLSKQQAHDLRQDLQNLELLCRKYKSMYKQLIQENEQLRKKLDEANEENVDLQQKSLIAEKLELKVQDLVQIKDEECAIHMAKISQLQFLLQSEMNKVTMLTREKNLLLHDNHELQHRLIVINEVQRQLEADYQYAKKMAITLQNQLHAPKEDLWLEQYGQAVNSQHEDIRPKFEEPSAGLLAHLAHTFRSESNPISKIHAYSERNTGSTLTVNMCQFDEFLRQWIDH